MVSKIASTLLLYLEPPIFLLSFVFVWVLSINYTTIAMNIIKSVCYLYFSVFCSNDPYPSTYAENPSERWKFEETYFPSILIKEDFRLQTAHRSMNSDTAAILDASQTY
jgi:hypothetical protein